MAKIWRNRLEAGTQKWADCPERYREEVDGLFRADVAVGKISEKRYEEITGRSFS